MNAPIFLPYLCGERTPHNNAHAQAVLFGLTSTHCRSDLAYAVIEGVCFGLLDGFNTLSLQTTGDVVALSAVGGGSRSAVWMQLLADTLGVALTTHEASTAAAALGAARLGWLACGGNEAEVCIVPPVTNRFIPDGAQHTQLQTRALRFRQLYKTLCASFPGSNE
jgi:xylulokinase